MLYFVSASPQVQACNTNATQHVPRMSICLLLDLLQGAVVTLTPYEL